MNPIVSIIIPVFNREGLIRETLESILNQTYTNWECIIVDDQSTDNSIKEVKKFIEKDNRFKLYSRPLGTPKGANVCRNYGFNISKGKYVHWFDSDDIASVFCYELIVSLLEQNNVDFCRFGRKVFHNQLILEENSKPSIEKIVFIDRKNIYDLLTNTISFNTCNVLWKRESIGKERFSEAINYADEWEFYSRLLSNNLKGISTDTVLYYGRKHKESLTGRFYKNDEKLLKSKALAVKLVTENLVKKDILNFKTSVLLQTLSKKYKNKHVFSLLITSNTLTLGQKFYLLMRHLFFKLIVKLKK